MSLQGIGAAQVVSVPVPVNPLTVDRTVYVSTLGSDSNPGTQTLPFLTPARADAERQKYSTLNAKFRVILVGAGPYDFPALGFSACGANGNYIWMGDTSTIVLTGTATGDMVANVLPTSATGGVNAHREQWLRMTSGACADCVFQIIQNAANSFTVANMRARTSNGAIVAGDTWEVIVPTTVARVSTSTPINNWLGMSVNVPVSAVALFPRHWFYNIRFASTDASPVRAYGSQIGFSMCQFTTGANFYDSVVVGGLSIDQTLVSIISARLFVLLGAGFVVVTSGTFVIAAEAQVAGVISWTVTAPFLGPLSAFTWAGGRAGAATSINLGCAFGFQGAGQYQVISATITVSGQNSVFRGGSSTIDCQVVAGNCFRASLKGFVAFQNVAPIGGTTDPAGVAVDTTSGGVCLFQNVLPVATGGTPGSDLRTTNVPIAANAVLGAPNTSVANAADALIGETLARVA